MVTIIDAIMGSGKTSAAIEYIRSHPTDRFLFITPYLAEAERIKNACPESKFIVPSNNILEYEFKKQNHFAHLLREGRNVALTHVLYEMSDDSILLAISEMQYTVIVDEVSDIFMEAYQYNDEDVDIFASSDYIFKDENTETGITTLDVNKHKAYNGYVFRDAVSLMQSRRLVRITDGKNPHYYFWTLHKELFTCPKNAFVLTYMFEGSPFESFFKINKIDYSIGGVAKTENGEYCFTYSPAAPDSLKDIAAKIHVFDNAKLNSIGHNRNALSATWFRNNGISSDKMTTLRNNMYTFFMYYFKDKKVDRRLWATFKSGVGKLRGKGYWNSHIPFNSRATNDYRDKDTLAYCVNVFLNPSETIYFKSQGCPVDEDRYALSVMVQWLFRSAIRDGKEINVYVPSRRMRMLLVEWLARLSAGEPY